MRILEIIHDTDHPGTTQIDRWVEENPGFQTEKFPAYNGDAFPEPSMYDMILLHGGSQHLWNKDADPWLIPEIRYVRKALAEGTPVVGFCLGSQLIADALGGRVYPAREKEVGWLTVKIREGAESHPLLQGLEQGFESFLWHSDHYELPEICRSLAYTEAAPHQLFTGWRVPAVGFQFHPEYTKAIIRDYYLRCYETDWRGGRFTPAKEGFLEELERKPDPYGLFQLLMKNTLKWLDIQKRYIEKGVPNHASHVCNRTAENRQIDQGRCETDDPGAEHRDDPVGICGSARNQSGQADSGGDDRRGAGARDRLCRRRAGDGLR